MLSFVGQVVASPFHSPHETSDTPNETSDSPNETSDLPDETSDTPWKILKNVVRKAKKDRTKLQELKENNHELCKKYLNHLRQDLATPDECQSVKHIEEQLQEIKEDLERIQEKSSDRVVIEFVGATSSGKSTLINALIREERLPAGFTETTMCLIEIYTIDNEEWSVKVNGKTLSDRKDKEGIRDLLSAMSKEDVRKERSHLNINEGSVVRVGWPKKFSRHLPENVVLVDSPGYGESENCDQIVKNSCQKADIIVAVMDSMSPSKAHVTRLVKEVNCQYAFGVFTKWDEAIQKHEKEHSQISLDYVREKYTKQYLESVNSHDQRATIDEVFFVDSQHVLRQIKKNESSFPAQQFQNFESKLSSSAEELKRKSLKSEIERAPVKVEKDCEESQKIMVKRKEDELARLDEKINSLKDGSEKFISICRSFKTKISEEMSDGFTHDVIERFLKDIASGTLSEQEAFKSLCDTVNDKMKHAIAKVTTNANEEFKQWDNLMANFSNLSKSKFSAIESQASQLNIPCELPDDKYNPWKDPWSYFTGNFPKVVGLIAVAVAGGGLGFIAAEATLSGLLFSGLGGTGGGAAGFGAGFSLDKIVKKFWPISRRKLNSWKIYLEEQLKKSREDNMKFIDNKIQEIEGLKKRELGNAESKFQREKDELNDEKHPLNQRSNELEMEDAQVENEHDFSSQEVLDDGNDRSEASKQDFLRPRKQSYQKNESSFPAQQFLEFESKLSSSAGELKQKLLKREVKRAAEKVEKNCDEFQKIIKKRKYDKLASLRKKKISLKDGGEKFIKICTSLKAKITKEIGDRFMQDVIETFLKDIACGTLSEQEAFKNLCDTVNEKMTSAIANVMTNANEEFKQWDNLMTNFINLSESKFSAIESQASQLNIPCELPDDKYNPWKDPWTYFTGNIPKAAGLIAVAVAGGGIGFLAAEATVGALLLSGLGGTGGGAAGLGAGVGLDKIVKTFWPISRQKLNGWKLYLEEELKKLREDNKKLIDNEIEEIEKLRNSELYNAKSKFQKEEDSLNDEEHPLNQWSNKLDSRLKEAKRIRDEND